MRHRPMVSSLAFLALASVVGAQDQPADPARQADPADERLDVERPHELERIQGELKRIKTERERLAGKAPDLAAQVRELRHQDLSPVLNPRTEVVGLRLKEAIGRSLSTNPDYMIQLYVANSTREGVPQASAVFDPILTSSGAYGRARTPTFRGNAPIDAEFAETLNWTTTLGVRMVTGTQLSVTWSESHGRFVSPSALIAFAPGGTKSYRPSLQLNLTQPLLRDFGIDVNETGIRVAENDALASDATLADTYMNGVLAVEQAYWNLVLTEEQLRAQERSLSSSLKFLDDQRKKLEHGAGTRLEVTIAKAGVATTREAVIIAENALESARDQIIRLTDPSSELARWDVFVIPLDQPDLIAEPDLDASTAIRTALARRPDYTRAILALDSGERNLTYSQNQMLPRVDLVGSFRQDGLWEKYPKAWTYAASGRFYSWTAGVSLEFPLILRAERARVRAARQDLLSAKASLRALEATVILEVRKAIRDVRTAKARIEASRASRILAQERLEATRVQVETGTAVPRDVLIDLASLAQAETGEVQAFINYRLALSSLKISQGTLLDDWLEDLDPRVRAVLNREPYR